MNSKIKADIEELISKSNIFIEKHSLRKILIIIGFFFSFFILTRIGYDHYEVQYDCSENSDLIVDKIIECKQQYIDADIKNKQLELQSYKIEEEFSLQKLKAKLSKMDISKENLLSELKSIKKMSLSSEHNCYSEVREIMCKKIK